MSRSQGNSTSVTLPIEYIIMKYRQYFGLSWAQFVETPLDVFFLDLEMMSIEAEVEEAVLKSKVEEAKKVGKR